MKKTRTKYFERPISIEKVASKAFDNMLFSAYQKFNRETKKGINVEGVTYPILNGINLESMDKSMFIAINKQMGITYESVMNNFDLIPANAVGRKILKAVLESAEFIGVNVYEKNQGKIKVRYESSNPFDEAEEPVEEKDEKEEVAKEEGEAEDDKSGEEAEGNDKEESTETEEGTEETSAADEIEEENKDRAKGEEAADKAIDEEVDNSTEALQDALEGSIEEILHSDAMKQNISDIVDSILIKEKEYSEAETETNEKEEKTFKDTSEEGEAEESSEEGGEEEAPAEEGSEESSGSRNPFDEEVKEESAIFLLKESEYPDYLDSMAGDSIGVVMNDGSVDHMDVFNDSPLKSIPLDTILDMIRANFTEFEAKIDSDVFAGQTTESSRELALYAAMKRKAYNMVPKVGAMHIMFGCSNIMKI